jgi:hypothetical protein
VSGLDRGVAIAAEQDALIGFRLKLCEGSRQTAGRQAKRFHLGFHVMELQRGRGLVIAADGARPSRSLD